jgi:hypothetical protein
MNECVCPLPDTLRDIPESNCEFNVKQIQKIIFQIGGFKFGTTPDDHLDLATWQALKTASDRTKVSLTPLIGGDPVIAAGDAITEGGGDNTTLNGIPRVNGTNPAPFSCNFKAISPGQEEMLKELMCRNDLAVYFILEGGRIMHNRTTDKEVTSFDIQAYFFSDRNVAGFGTTDMNIMSFQLAAGWSGAMDIFKPNFNPLTEL